MKFRLLLGVLLLTVLAFGGCGGGNKSATADYDTIYKPEFARGFEIYRHGESSIIKILNPWQGAQNVNSLVFVSRGGENPPEGFDGVVIRQEVARTACMSSSHIAFLDALGNANSICAVSGDRYITNPMVRNRIASGDIRDVGYEGNINYELLVLLRPDVVFMYSVSGERLPVLDKLAELRIPVVMVGEYLETTPLGKAEWIVLFGEILGCMEKAESIFSKICRDYMEAKDLTRDIAHRPVVMLNSPWKDTWFVPGDRSYMVELLRDAGAQYACAGVDSEQSRAINGETAYLYASKAEFWLNPNEAETLDRLRTDNPNFVNIPPMISGKVYNNNLRSTPGGGSDFWESGAVYPNMVLNDMIFIFHPELLPGHELYYFRKLQ